MNILMLCSTFPYPPTQGRKQLRTFHLLQHLVSNHKVTLVTQCTKEVTTEEVEMLQQQVTELVMFPVSSSYQTVGLMGKAKHLSTFVRQGTPPEVFKTYSAEIATWVKEAINHGQFEVIACEDSSDEIYIDSQWRQEIATVLDLQCSKYGKYKQQLETGDSHNEIKDRINLGLRKRYEQNYLDKFKAIVTVTEKDRRIVKELAPESQIVAIPNGVDLTKFPRRVTNQGGQRIVFVGNMDRPSNIDAASFLTLEIFPEIRKRYPEAALELVGANPADEVLQLNAISGVTVTGEVKSVVEYLHWATVCVIAIRKGFGLKNRTLEAMAAGVPVVGSDRALAGLKVDGANVPLRAMRANKLEEYIYAIGRLFSEPKLREKLSENGRLLVETEYTWDRVGQKYEQVLIDASGTYSSFQMSKLH
ncbi:MAG: glycosyltransferase family 4 protein [Pleurocapsa sp.]